MKVNQKLAITIFIIEVVLCSGEGISIIRNHMNNIE
jgi:hypothetical protein